MNMNWLLKQEVKIKRSHFKNLVSLALIDGDLAPNELDWLRHTASSWGLTEQDVETVFSAPDSVPLVFPTDVNDQISELYDLAVMIIADGEVYEAEVDFVQTLAVRMGFKPSIVPDMIRQIFKDAQEQRQPSIDAREFLGS